jgi:cold shock CspA family protein
MSLSAGEDGDIFSSINDDELAAIDLSGAITSAKQSPSGNSPLLHPASSEEADRATTSKASLTPEGAAATEGGIHQSENANARIATAEADARIATAEADAQHTATGAVAMSASEAPTNLATQTSASPLHNNPSCQPILREEADACAATAEKIQQALIHQCKTKGLKSIGHVGVLHRLANLLCPTPATPGHFFTRSNETITIGSAPKCDLSFKGMKPHGMSDIALRLTRGEGRLSIISLNRSDASFRLIRADEAEFLLIKDQEHNIYRGDSIAFGILKRGSFELILRILFHRAPAETMNAQAHGTNTKTPAAAKSRKRAYPESRGGKDLKKAKRLKDRCSKAAFRLHAGKNMSHKERKGARDLLSQTGEKACPFEQQFTNCTDPKCPFRHQSKTGGNKNKYNNGDISTGVVRKWQWLKEKDAGFGFVKNSDGVDFFMHSSRLKFDGRDLGEGATVKFEIKLNAKQGQLDYAINAVLN